MPTGEEILYLAIVDYTYKGQTCKNLLWFVSKNNSPHASVENEIADIAINVTSWFTTVYQAFCNNQVQFLQLTVKAMSGNVPMQVIGNYINTYGAIAGDGLPPHDAAVISLYTQFHGRSAHGRLYLTGISEGDQEGGLLTDAALARLNAVGQSLMQRFSLSGSYGTANGVVFSRKSGIIHDPLTPNIPIYRVEGGITWHRFVAHRQIRTQRHRLIPY